MSAFLCRTNNHLRKAGFPAIENAEVDFDTKAKALAQCDVPDVEKVPRRWRDRPALMDFLHTL